MEVSPADGFKLVYIKKLVIGEFLCAAGPAKFDLATYAISLLSELAKTPEDVAKVIT